MCSVSLTRPTGFDALLLHELCPEKTETGDAEYTVELMRMDSVKFSLRMRCMAHPSRESAAMLREVVGVAYLQDKMGYVRVTCTLLNGPQIAYAFVPQTHWLQLLNVNGSK